MTTTSPTLPPVVTPEARPREAVVELQALTKSYQDPQHPAVDRLTLTVYRGEKLALLGPSGCGKTTLLRLIAGFEVPDAGRIYIGGREVASRERWLEPEKRKIGFVFQDYALFPHLDVLGNVAFGLSHLPKRKRLERAREIIDLVGLTIFSRRYPHQLSGGQQQRVAVARALAPQPEVILLDEPFSNLDAALRGATREEVRRILDVTETTAILVTHDQEEAMTFADRLAVMRAGRLEQEGAPEAVYLRPRTAFVASFLGSTNLLRGTARGSVADTILGPVPLTQAAEGSVLLSVRPEDLVFDEARGVEVRVLGREFKGHDLTFSCQTLPPPGQAPQRLMVQTGPECPVRVGEVLRLYSRGPGVPLEASG